MLQSAVTMKDRVILHCDMNGFFASIELLDYPELRDKPMAVCGNPRSRHGIILAKNEIAKARNSNSGNSVAGKEEVPGSGNSSSSSRKIQTLQRTDKRTLSGIYRSGGTVQH